MLINISNEIKTKEQLKEELFAKLQNMSTTNYINLLALYNSGNTLIWNNPDGLSPQEGFDAMGTSAALFLAIGQKTAELLNTAVPGSIDPTPPASLTVNQDGTITVNS